LTTKENIPLTIKHYLKHMSKLTEQYFDDPERYRDKTRQRIYLKDIDCPPVWHDKLKEHIPAGLFYLNESTGEIGGPGALDEPGHRKGRGIARAGDLMSSLPPEMRAENLMCYIGHEGTYTPAHREMCASLGQNIMVNASGAIGEDGKPERPGSSLWFMTETKDRHLVSEYWLSVLGHDIEVENHFAQLIAWRKAPFKTYVVEQRPGDFILIPPLAPHQVWNRGTRTMKIAWNRTTVETLELAISEALPNSRVVCRDEQYKNKAIIYYTLLKYSSLIKSARAQVELGGEQAEAIQTSVKVRQVQRDFKRLFELYKKILLSEMFAPDSREHPEYLPFDSNVTCAYCRCNIFNRFLTCKACKHEFSKEIEEPYDVCMDCYCMGRSCHCQSGYTWVEQWKWKDLLHRYEEWRAQIIDIDGHVTDKTPLPIMEERRYHGKKTLAQVCQEQLKLRPFVDPNAPAPPEENSSDEEIIVNDDGTVKKTKKRKSKKWLSTHKSCHFCLHKHPNWKMAFCSSCGLSYCYGTLFRAHDMMPFTVMQEPSWKCPHCERRCNTGACRKDPRQHPYQPKGTLLGHDTKKVADPRSTECLVDFSVSNLNWLREDDLPMQQRLTEAELAKANDPTFDDRYMDEDVGYGNRNGITYSPVQDTDPNAPAEGVNGNGYVNPAAVMYQPDVDMNNGAYESYYPDPDPNGEIPRLGKRTRDDEENDADDPRQKKRKKPQRKKKDENSHPAIPKHVSGKEYQKEIQKKLVEDAKRDDRFIMTMARMKGKSLKVKLTLDSGLLQNIAQRVAPSRPQVPAQETGGFTLQSDVLPGPSNDDNTQEKAKGPTSFRVKVAKDDSYTPRRRGSAGQPGYKPGRPGRPKGSKSRNYEEVTVDSDEFSEIGENDTEYGGPSNGRSKGRSSAWLARKNQGEEDLPTELPPDFRDGAVNRRERDRERDRERRERRKTMPAKQKAGIRLPGRPPRKSTGNMSDEDGLHDNDNGSALELAQSAAAALEAAARKAQEEKAKADAEEKARAEAEAAENLRAKMALWDEDNDVGLSGGPDGFIDDFAAADEPLHEERNPAQDEEMLSASPEAVRTQIQEDESSSVSPEATRTQPLQTENSILTRPGMSGRKIKIVSAKQNGVEKSSTSLAISVPMSSFTVNNKSSVTVDVSESSDSDSDRSIPAEAPTKATTKAPAKGRLVPTRGGSARGRGPGRGRGRPRGS
jgi:hypothetical protein